MSTNYWDYLRLDKLLDLQGGLEGDEQQLMPDELHFIIVHQAFELWFKLTLRELRLARDHLSKPEVPEEAIPYVVHHLRRVGEIMKLCVDQFRVMETLTPQDFLAFRDKLVPASGFQSFQMRELEILLGLGGDDRLNYGNTNPLDHIEKLALTSPSGAMARDRLRAALSESTLKSALDTWLYRTPVQGSSPTDAGDTEAVDAFVGEYFAATQELNRQKVKTMSAALGGTAAQLEERFAKTEDEARQFLYALDAPEADRARTKRIRAGVVFIESYRELPLLAWPRLLIDTVVEAEEQLVLWRSRHARMVERIIGRRIGTGGSSGVDYLDKTAQYRIFKELWTVRTILLPKPALPELKHPEAYGFAN